MKVYHAFKEISWSFHLVFFAFVLSCGVAANIGSLSGTVVQGEVTSAVNVTFSVVDVTDDANGNLSIELSNISGDTALFLLQPANASAEGLDQQFTTGNYTISPSGSQFSASIKVQGATASNISGKSGIFQLQAFGVGVDSITNQPAVAFIGGAFEIDLEGGGAEGGGFITGSFEKDFR